MARRALPVGFKSAHVGIRNMRLVIWAVDVLPVPACREGDGSPDSSGAEALGKARRI